MTNHTRTQQDTTAGENPTSILTNKDARWLIKVRLECISFILRQDDKISPEDAEDIYSNEFVILSDRGMIDLYSLELRELIALDRYWVSDEERLALLKYHLKERRIPDFFRHKTAAKRDYRKEKFLPDYKWLSVEQENRPGDLYHRALNEKFAYLLSQMGKSTHFDKKDIAILSAAVSGQLTKLRRDQLYEVMPTTDLNFFLPADGKAAPDLRDSIIKAIGKRSTRTMTKIRKFLDNSEGRFNTVSA